MDSRRNKDVSAQFGELRSLLLRPASAQSWRTLTHLLEQWSDPEHLAHVVVPYVLDHLERWDSALRRAPHSWKYALTHALESSPFLRTLGELPLNAKHLCVESSEARIARLHILAAHFGDIRHLSLEEDVGELSYPDDVESFDELIAPFLDNADWLGKVEVLSLFMHDNASSDRALEALCDHFATCSARLERLTLRAEEVSPKSLASFTALLDANPALQRLELSTLGQLDDMLVALHRSSTWPSELALSCYKSCDLGSFFAHEDTRAHHFNAFEIALDARRRTDHTECVLTHPSFAHLSHLKINFENSPQPNDAFTFRWAARPGVLNELLSLQLSGDYLHSSSVDALAERGAFEHLRELTIADSSFSEPHTLAELTTGVSSALETLTFSHRFERARVDLGAALASPTLCGVKSLTCHHFHDTGHGVAKFAQMRHFEQLEHLTLSLLAIDDEAAQYLGASPTLGNLRKLVFKQNGLSERGLVALAKSFHLYRLESLTLSNNVITPQAMIALAEAGWAAPLQEIELRRCHIGDLAMRVLLNASEGWAQLRSLDLASNELSAQVLIELCENEVVEQLQWLNVHDNPGACDDAFITYLERADHLPPWMLASLRHQAGLTMRSSP